MLGQDEHETDTKNGKKPIHAFESLNSDVRATSHAKLRFWAQINSKQTEKI